MAEPHAETNQPIAEISHGPSAFEGFLDRNQKPLIGVGILAALGLGAMVVMNGLEEGANTAAGEALLDAEEIAAMQDVAKNHASTPSAPTAELLLSDLQWEQGQQTAAIETLQSLIASNPDHPAAYPAQARLGARLIEQGSLDEAAEALETLLDTPKAAYLAPYALSCLAEIASQRGDTDEASRLLDEASNSYIESPFNQTVSEHRRYLGFEMPTEIDPPAPAPVEPIPAIDDSSLAPEPDLSTPIEFDPTQPGTGTGSNPLFDNLTPTEDQSQPEPPNGGE
ncbi:MAG: tetratricopeptide repeat protein [Verrucomicrobiales bacterium]